MRLEAFFKKYARNRGVTMAEKAAVAMRKLVGKQAPTRVTASGRIVATTPATPFAPPRKVSGNLQSKIRIVRTAHGARLVCWAPYSIPLEYSFRRRGFPHRFFWKALAQIGVKKK